MRKTDYEVRRGRRIDSGYVFAQKRPVGNSSYGINIYNDDSKDIDMVLCDKVDLASLSGTPTVLNLYFTATKNESLRKYRPLVDLYIPIVPIAYDSNSKKDLSFLTSSANPNQYAIDQYKTMDHETKRTRTNDYALEIFNYTSYELGIKYAQAKKIGDVATMKAIKGIHMVKDFDFDTLSDLLDRKVQKATPENISLIKGFKTYLQTKEKYQELARTFEDYQYYEIDRELDKEKLDYSKLMIDQEFEHE